MTPSPAINAKSKTKSPYRCIECGWTTPKWVGQCRECQTWGSIDDTPGPSSFGANLAIVAQTPKQVAQPIASVSLDQVSAWPSGVSELDRVLGGGIVPGAVIFLAGEPGVGKSTLLLDVAARAARGFAGEHKVLYLTGEESASQIRLRAGRIGALAPNLLLAAEQDLEMVLGQIEHCNPALVIIDSVQTLSCNQVEGAAGGVAQVRAVATGLIAAAKQRSIPILLVGHVTKDGGIAGPRTLEHLVDVVCQFEGDRHTRLRLLRAVKNRYGPTDEVGCFELTERGIIGLEDPSGLFLSQGSPGVAGTCVAVTLEGRRPMPCEIQSLVVNTASANPRRTTSGLDYARVGMTLAVLQSRLGIPLANADVFVSTVGGARTNEPAVDLAVALAVTSAARSLALPGDQVAVGEVALTGEVRATIGVQRRLQEAVRLGFSRALVPVLGHEELRPPPGMEIIPVATIAQAITACGLGKN